MFRVFTGRKEEWDGMRTLVIDLAIAIDVRLTDHLVDLPVRELLSCTQKPSPMKKKTPKISPKRMEGRTETSHDVPQLGG